MIGIIKVVFVYVYILFDPRATHFFISSEFARKADLMLVPLDYEWVSLPRMEAFFWLT